MTYREIYEFYRYTFNIKEKRMLSELSNNSYAIEKNRKTEFLLDDDYFQNKILFLFDGIFYFFRLKESGRMIIDNIFWKKGIPINISSINNYYKSDKVRLAINSKIVVLDFEKIDNNTLRSFFKQIEVKSVYSAFIHTQDLLYLRSLSSEKRIIYFLNNYGMIASQLSHTEIASILDINRQEFSSKLKSCNISTKKTQE